MKLKVSELKRNQELWAIVEETLEKEQLIVNLGGDLLRVSNATTKTFRTGERVLLKVEATDPLQFKLISPASGRRNARATLDLNA